MAAHIKIVVTMNGIVYEEEEAKQLVENAMERSNLQVESVSLLHATSAASTKTATKKKSKKKKKKVASE